MWASVPECLDAAAFHDPAASKQKETEQFRNHDDVEVVREQVDYADERDDGAADCCCVIVSVALFLLFGNAVSAFDEDEEHVCSEYDGNEVA